MLDPKKLRVMMGNEQIVVRLEITRAEGYFTVAHARAYYLWSDDGVPYGGEVIYDYDSAPEPT